MLPWFKADTDEIVDGMLDYEWSSPAPYYLAAIEWRAIVAANREAKWSHARLAKRWQRPVCWVRRLRENIPSQAFSKQIAGGSQEDSKGIARTSQDDSKDIAWQSQGRSRGGAGSGVFDSKAIADASHDGSKMVAEVSQEDSKEHAGSRARVLDPKILRSENRDQEREEEKKHPPTPQGGSANAAAQPTQLAIVPPPSPSTSKRKGSSTEASPALPGVLASLTSRPDAGMWAALWSKLHVGHKPFILEIVKVWDAYRATFPERRVLDDDGANKIGEALRLGYSVEDLCKVPAGARLSPFHMGENDKGKRYIDVVSLYREAKTIDAHIERLNPPKTAAKPATRNIYGGQQEGIDWDAELKGGR